MSRRRLRLIAAAGALLVLVMTAIVTAVVTGPSATPAALSEEVAELSPAMAAKFAQQQKFAPPGSKQEGDRSAADDEWMKHAIPGDTIPSAAIEGSSSDWAQLSSRSAKGAGKWKPLGPTWAKGLPNAYRDRSVYNAATPDFSGRIAHTVIDPNCGSNRHDDDDDDADDRGSCRLWIANANGGVWVTNNALAKKPQWKYVSEDFEHNSVASLELDPNDKRSNTIYAGTGEPNACGSGCEAGVGIYKSTNGGERWSGPFGKTAGPACGPGNPSPCKPFYNRAVGSIEVKPGDSKTIFAATGRAIRGLTSSCCAGADALIPGAAHFGLYRSQDGGENWTLVHQGAATDCTASTPDQVSLSQTPCSPRGARRVYIDPVDPNTVYVSFFGRGIWRSRANGNPGTFEQIMAPVTPIFATAAGGAERAEFDIVKLPSGETRMYVGVGGGGVAAIFRRNDAVRLAPAATVAASWITLSSSTIDTPGYSSFNYCGQCSYDNYVFAPARHFPNSGASPDVVYLSGDNRYAENDWGPLSPRANIPNNVPANGRDSGRAVGLTTNGGAPPGTQYFTDMTEDTTHNFYPVALHPDHHALTVNPRDYRQFFDVGDGGIVRSNGRFADDSGDCVQPKGYTGTALAFCQLMLSRVPERLETMNKGLRTLHFYQLDVSPFDDDTIVGGTQDNGSWERGDGPGSGTNSGPVVLPPAGVGIDTDEFPSERDCLGRGRGDDDDDDDNGNRGSGGEQVWVNTNIADGGHNGFDLGDPCFRLSGWQQGQTMVTYDPKNQLDMNWTSDTHFVLYGGEANAFIGLANDDNTVAHRLWSARQHAFRSDNQGRNPILTKQTHREHCNVWYGDADVDDNGVYEPTKDLCDDWMPLGDPGPNGRLTHGPFGTTKVGGYVSVIEPAWDGQTLWTATQLGRVLVSKNAGGPEAAVTFDRIDDDVTALPNAPNRFVSAIYVDPKDPNRAWIVYSGFNAKDTIPGHVFEVRYVPGASTFKLLDGNEPRDRMGDIPATSVAVSDKGTIYVGTDYGVIASSGDGVWREAGKGLPRMPAPDLMYIPGKKKLYAATHGQGVWELKVKDIEGDD